MNYNPGCRSIPEYKEIYKSILFALEKTKLTRKEIIRTVIDSFPLNECDRCNDDMNSHLTKLRSSIGIVLNDMVARKLIIKELPEGASVHLYRRAEDITILIRVEECEREMLRMVKERPMSKQELREALIRSFGTDMTATNRDDNKLLTYMGQILKRLVAEEIFTLSDGKYSILGEKSAFIKDRRELLLLKGAFLARVHSKGGEFFEHYFMNLLAKYLTRSGKTVIDSHVKGGAEDGGIDGICNTVDTLGFRETIMVQTKNRSEQVIETTVRGFYGAVCAFQGSRGIFATISDFHPAAQKFLDSIDNCVGVNGERIFAMACDTSYGIRREGEKLIIDYDII